MAAAALNKLGFSVRIEDQSSHPLLSSVAQKPAAFVLPFKTLQPRIPALNISQIFTKLRKQGKVALIPYIMAGDPDLSTTAEALKLLDSCGSDVIELGVPNSDPILDGPVIRAACSRSLSKGINFESILSMIKTILEYGTRKFMADLNDAGVHGLLVPDVRLAESVTLREEAFKNGIEMPLLTTPITPTEQMKTIVEAAQGFVYLVSSVGVTGARASVNPRVESLLDEIKQVTHKPVAVGFGISKPEHARQIARWGADGVIVGSAIVKLLGEAKSPEEGLEKIETFIRSLKETLP